MRELPRTTRIAIATLYLRYREARGYFTEKAGSDVPAWKLVRARASETEAWNALQVVYRKVLDEHWGRRERTDPKEMLRMAAQGARVRDRARKTVDLTF